MLGSPQKEILIGAGLGLLVVFYWIGVDLLPIIVFVGLAVMFKLTVDGRIGTKKLEVIGSASGTRQTSPVTFDDIGGQEVAKRELIEALEFITHAEQCSKLGIRPLKGVLLCGPPGTGKTLLAKAAANYTNSVFVAASGSGFVEMYAGVGASRVRELFQRAKALARRQGLRSAIIFIDEIEVLGGKRGSNTSHLEYDQTLNQLLVAMDGINPDDDVRILVIGATNRQDLLDDALLRPGRFDRIVQVDLPDKEGRLHILKIHSRGKPLASEVSLEEVAAETFGFSGAHLESLLNEAAIAAMREGSAVILQKHVKEAIDKVMMGERLARRPNARELARVAHHEIGHAVVSELVRPGSVSAVTVSSRGSALGYMRQVPEDDRYLYSQEEMEDRIAVLLGGAVSEEIFYGSKSTGSMGDFDEAVKIAKRMVYAGMSTLGIVSPKDLSGKELHEAVQKIIAEQHRRVTNLLTPKKLLVGRLADALQQAERLDGEAIRSALRQEAA